MLFHCRYQDFWETQHGRCAPHLLDSDKRVAEMVDVYPLHMCIDQDQEQSTQERPSIVCMDSQPRFLWPLPGMLRAGWGLWQVTWQAVQDFTGLLNLYVNTRPPHMLTGETLHSRNPTVGFMLMTWPSLGLWAEQRSCCLTASNHPVNWACLSFSNKGVTPSVHDPPCQAYRAAWSISRWPWVGDDLSVTGFVLLKLDPWTFASSDGLSLGGGDYGRCCGQGQVTEGISIVVILSCLLSNSAHHWSHVEAIAGVALDGLNRCTKGRWSDRMVNNRP